MCYLGKNDMKLILVANLFVVFLNEITENQTPWVCSFDLFNLFPWLLIQDALFYRTASLLKSYNFFQS